MFKITNMDIARAVQSRKGYVYDFGGRRFFLMRACRSDGCEFDFCAGLSSSCVDIVRQRMIGPLVTSDEFSELKMIDSRLAAEGDVFTIEENGEVVFSDVLDEDCLVVKFEGPLTTRLKLIPDRLYAVGTGPDAANGLLMQAVSATHARDVFGRLHDLRCSMTARLLVEGTLGKKTGPETGRTDRPLQDPPFDPSRGTILVNKGDFADPLPHEVRGLAEKEQQDIVENGLSGSPSSIPLVGERVYSESEMLDFEVETAYGTFLLDRFGAALAETPNDTDITPAAFQNMADAIGRFEAAKAIFGIPAAPAPLRISGMDDLAYAIELVNHADSQVEGMRRKIVFTSAASDGDIRAGLLNPTAAFGGSRASVGDAREMVGESARASATRTNDLLGLVRQNRLSADVMVQAHRVWFRLEGYRQRILELEPVFRLNRSALDGLTGDALEDVGSKIGAATAELFMTLRILGADVNFGRTTLEASERGRLYQALNAHPDILHNISVALAATMKLEAIDVPRPGGSEDTSPQSIIDVGFGVRPSQLDEIEQLFANTLGPNGFDPATGEIPADGQHDLESKLSALFGTPEVSGIIPGSLADIADRSALYQEGRIDAPERFV